MLRVELLLEVNTLFVLRVQQRSRAMKSVDSQKPNHRTVLVKSILGRSRFHYGSDLSTRLVHRTQFEVRILLLGEQLRWW